MVSYMLRGFCILASAHGKILYELHTLYINCNVQGVAHEYMNKVSPQNTPKIGETQAIQLFSGSTRGTRGMLEVLQRHYQQLGKLSLDSNFDAEWKEGVESNMSRYGSMSELCEDEFLDKKGEIVKCIREE